MSKDLSNREIIVAQLNLLPGPKKMGSNGWMQVVCPFHDDNSPSCGVRVSEPALGVYNCLSCEAKGGWNKFAEKTGLEKIKEWNKSADLNAEAVVNQETDDQLLGDTGLTFKEVIHRFNAPEATIWPEAIDWRGYPGWFMRKLGAHIVSDHYADSVAAILPIKIAGRVRGGVKAAFIKDEKNKRALSYQTMRGSWVQDYGLFPYMYARGLIKKGRLNFVVMVEGPRDAMRLCLNGIPAIAVLGSKNITKRKILFATALGVDVVYVMPDNDTAGKMMWRKVRDFCKDAEIPAKRIKLPRERDAKGEVIKMDPGNAPKKIIRQFMRFLNEEHETYEMPVKII